MQYARFAACIQVQSRFVGGDAVAMPERGGLVSEPQGPAFATREPPFDAITHLYRPELFRLPPPEQV